MLFVKLTRPETGSTMIAGPFEDDIDARYTCKQLDKADVNPESVYEVVNCQWVVTVRPEGEEGQGEVIEWHETEADARKSAGIIQRGDWTKVVAPMKYEG